MQTSALQYVKVTLQMNTQNVALLNCKEHTQKLTLRETEQTEFGLVAFYDIWRGNGAGLFLQSRSLRGATEGRNNHILQTCSLQAHLGSFNPDFTT